MTLIQNVRLCLRLSSPRMIFADWITTLLEISHRGLYQFCVWWQVGVIVNKLILDNVCSGVKLLSLALPFSER